MVLWVRNMFLERAMCFSRAANFVWGNHFLRFWSTLPCTRPTVNGLLNGAGALARRCQPYKGMAASRKIPRPQGKEGGCFLISCRRQAYYSQRAAAVAYHAVRPLLPSMWAPCTKAFQGANASKVQPGKAGKKPACNNFKPGIQQAKAYCQPHRPKGDALLQAVQAQGC